MCVVCPVHTLQVKYKIGLCHLAVHDTRSALSEVLLYSNPLVYTHPILSCNLTVLLVVLVAWCFVRNLPWDEVVSLFSSLVCMTRI